MLELESKLINANPQNKANAIQVYTVFDKPLAKYMERENQYIFVNQKAKIFARKPKAKYKCVGIFHNHTKWRGSPNQ